MAATKKEESPKDVITVSHPRAKLQTTMTRRQFDTVYAKKGWEKGELAEESSSSSASANAGAGSGSGS